MQTYRYKLAFPNIFFISSSSYFSSPSSSPTPSPTMSDVVPSAPATTGAAPLPSIISSLSSTPPPPSPLHRFGLIADVQYVDDDDGFNYQKTRRRYYRHGLVQLKKAIDRWREERVDRVIQLGDLIDGKSRRQGKRDLDFATLRTALANLPVPWHHCVGNHERYNFSEKELRRWLSEDAKGGEDTMIENYYAFSPVAGFVIIVLHSYEISDVNVYQNDVDNDDDENSSLRHRLEEARVLLKTHNPNQDKNSPTGLEGFERRWCAFNGGLGNDQLAWLDRTLEEAGAKGERAMIVSHVPLHPEAVADLIDLAWDYKLALEIVKRRSDVVVAVFAGHDHDGGHFFDETNNILFLTLSAVLETDPTSTSFAVCDLFRDKLQVRGFGKAPSFVVNF